MDTPPMRHFAIRQFTYILDTSHSTAFFANGHHKNRNPTIHTATVSTLCSEKYRLVFSSIFPRKIFWLLRKFQGMFGRY